MQGIACKSSTICAQCLRRSQLANEWRAARVRHYGSQKPSPQPPNTESRKSPSDEDAEEKGAMSRRLAEMSDSLLETRVKGARRAIGEAGFTGELKRALEEKLARVSFDEGAIEEQADDVNETANETSLRKLTDTYKPLHGASRPGAAKGAAREDNSRTKAGATTGSRLASARDRSSVYSVLKDTSLSEEEREKYRAELKARFQPASRTMPATLQGLQSLANQRIEDAIARGQFKNLPRGKGKQIERDHNANSPFINTTEYFMNKMIQRQEITPPWIEKQQELLLTATRFRARLRSDWKRHVSRSIASRGGSLETQIAQAEEYARAELLANPSAKQVEAINVVQDDGHISQITVAGELHVEPSATGSDVATSEIKMVGQAVHEDGSLSRPDTEVVVAAEHPALSASRTTPVDLTSPRSAPFRDAAWQKTEGPYLAAAVANLNNLTRTYNLMAPDSARKPYFSLDREMRACFADVAPQIAANIRERASRPKIKSVEIVGHKPGGVLDKFSMDSAAHVFDEQKPQYGFKQFWRDLFSRKERT